MKQQKTFKEGFEYFFHPRVFIFILIGTLVIFLTFFTQNNALEIAISGIASIFIGIGVNNLSSLETHSQDEKTFTLQTQHAVQVLELVRSQLYRLEQDPKIEEHIPIKAELQELGDFIALSIKLITEKDSATKPIDA